MQSAQWIRESSNDYGIECLARDGTVINRSLIENYDDSALEYIEGSSFDFTIDELSEIDDVLTINDDSVYAHTFIGKDIRIIPSHKIVKPIGCGTTIEFNNMGIKKGIFVDADEKVAVDYLLNRGVNKEDIISVTQQCDVYILPPNQYFMASTVQAVNLPVDVAMLLNTRTSMFRGGIEIHCSWANPNYQGILNVGIRNMRSAFAYIQRGARFITAHFFKIDVVGGNNGSAQTRILAKYTDPYGCSKQCASPWQGGVSSSENKPIKAY